ncbi:MAG: FAD-dependent oxidoreductase, partial [Alphaproteobacteria bacterium]|nr:FAD-dependent oxidoreductase [Alphaproteobacteria bacterium]
MAEKLVIIGNGMAPGRMLEHLFDCAPGRFDVTIFNAESRVNYNRLMLSPVLSGEKTYEEIITHGDEWYADNNVTLHKSAPVTLIDREAKTVLSTTGIVAPYDRLVIATGSSPFVPPIPGHQLEGVITYRDLDDVDRMIAACGRGARAVVLGGGLLGLEAAAGLRMRGIEVTVL